MFAHVNIDPVGEPDDPLYHYRRPTRAQSYSKSNCLLAKQSVQSTNTITPQNNKFLISPGMKHN